MVSCEPSVEASSATMISCGVTLCSSTLSIASFRYPPLLYEVMMTLIRMSAGLIAFLDSGFAIRRDPSFHVVLGVQVPPRARRRQQSLRDPFTGVALQLAWA